MTGDQALHGGEADAVAGELLGRVKALEGAEEVLRARSMSKPAPSSRTKKARSPPSSAAPTSMRAVSCLEVNFQALLEQVGEDPAQQRGVGGGVQPRRDHDLDAPLGLRRPQLVDDRRAIALTSTVSQSSSWRLARDSASSWSMSSAMRWAAARTRCRCSVVGRSSRSPASSITIWQKPSMARSGVRRSCEAE